MLSYEQKQNPTIQFSYFQLVVSVEQNKLLVAFLEYSIFCPPHASVIILFVLVHFSLVLGFVVGDSRLLGAFNCSHLLAEIHRVLQFCSNLYSRMKSESN